MREVGAPLQRCAVLPRAPEVGEEPLPVPIPCLFPSPACSYPLPVPIPCPPLFAPISQAGKLRHVTTCPPCEPPEPAAVLAAPNPLTTPRTLVLAELHLHGLDTEHGTVFPPGWVG